MRRVPPWTWPLLVAAVSLGITGWLWQHEREVQDHTLRNSFDFGLRQAATRVEARVTSYEQMLRGVGGLFAASDGVTKADFATYVDLMASGPDFAGLRSIGYAPLHQSEPAGGLLDGVAPLLYTAPVAGPIVGALGEDLLRDPVRRAAMMKARDSGSIVATQRLPALGRDTEAQWGFLLFMPVYARDLPNDNVALRRVSLSGWVMASFLIGDLMSSLYGEGIPGLDVRIYDGVRIDDGARLYPTAATAASLRPARFEAHEYLDFSGHTWTLAVRSTPDFEQPFSGNSARIIAVAGAGLSLLLAVLTWQLVTGRDRAHAAARDMTEQLRAGSERYRRIVETADEGIWMIDADSRTSFVNPKMLRMLGQDAATMLGRPWTDFVDEAGRAALSGGADGTFGGAARQLEICFRRHDGTDLWASVSTSPILDEGGLRTGLLAMVTDVTMHRLTEANRILLESQLRQSQKMEAIGTLAGGVAHDFNNILASILGNVALVQQDVPAGDRLAGRVEQIRLAGERGRSLVQQIAAFSRSEAQERIDQPLRPLLEEAAKLLRSTLPALVELELRLSDAPLQISADSTQLQQVLINLCTNAWHAMPDGKGRIVIGLDSVMLDAATAQRLGSLLPGRHAHVRVSDDGCGMDEATRQRIFEPFYTTKAVGKGTGLGLSVVHGIVASHAGVITVDSLPGKGSTFDMYFPLVTRVAEPLSAPVARGRPIQGNGEHVLYVDDDPVMVLMVEALLQRSGFRVTGVADAKRALALANAPEQAVDVVVTDFNMPELSGLDLARDLALCRPGLPVVITSGNISEKLRVDAARFGIRYLLQKEFTLEQLAMLVQRALRDRGSSTDFVAQSDPGPGVSAAS